MFKLQPFALALFCLTSQAECDWSKPGENPYTGRAGAAVRKLSGIPWLERQALIYRVTRAAPDDNVNIGRDKIAGVNGAYANEIRNMHFGNAGQICPSVSRAGWAPGHIEPAQAWCVNEVFGPRTFCVAKPLVCSNYFEITRLDPARTKTNTVPEPGALALVVVGLLCAFVSRRK